jgi:predicted regulator of Ras-like GTPase activity (Roadblock/LC7/MglB family)
VREVLEPIAGLPGVRIAVLVTSDGVPIAVQGQVDGRAEAAREAPWRDVLSTHDEPPSGGEHIDSSEDLNVLAALATGWLADVTRSVAPLSWGPPRYLVLRAARGTLILMQGPNAVLLVQLDGGMRAEDLRLPMESAIARMQRVLRGIGRTDEPASDKPPGIFPALRTTARPGVDSAKGVPEVSGGR